MPSGAARGRHRLIGLGSASLRSPRRTPEETRPAGAAQCSLGRRSHGGSCPLLLCPPTAHGLGVAAPGSHAGRRPAAQHQAVPRGDPDQARGSLPGAPAGDSR